METSHGIMENLEEVGEATTKTITKSAMVNLKTTINNRATHSEHRTVTNSNLS